MDQHVEVLTIGHSTLPYERFAALLKDAGVTAISDVRSSPFSRRSPHFNKDELQAALAADGISYVFMGRELGGRPRNPRFYCDGVADYEAMRTADAFKRGIERVITGADKYKLALMCSEHHPLDCHRCLLVGRALVDKEIQVKHIFGDGKQRSQAQLEAELLNEFGSESMFDYEGDILTAAYRHRSKRVAYVKPRNFNQAAE